MVRPDGMAPLGRALSSESCGLSAPVGNEATPALICGSSELTRPEGSAVTTGTLTPDGNTPLVRALI
jgi:hypothetical protein